MGFLKGNMESSGQGWMQQIAAIDERIAEAQLEFPRPCEVCGQPGRQLETGGWIQTLCDEHAQSPEQQ